jgi:hypothetical protein
MKHNINDMCRVKLTDVGHEILTDYYSNYISGLYKDGYYHAELWLIMKIFGHHFFHHMTQMVFVNNAIEIEYEDN